MRSACRAHGPGVAQHRTARRCQHYTLVPHTGLLGCLRGCLQAIEGSVPCCCHMAAHAGLKLCVCAGTAKSLSDLHRQQLPLQQILGGHCRILTLAIHWQLHAKNVHFQHTSQSTHLRGSEAPVIPLAQQPPAHVLQGCRIPAAADAPHDLICRQIPHC
jgi:hypothetical protein